MKARGRQHAGPQTQRHGSQNRFRLDLPLSLCREPWLDSVRSWQERAVSKCGQGRRARELGHLRRYGPHGRRRSQAAKKGGDCGQNIGVVYRHLESGWAEQAAPTTPHLWARVLGEAAQPSNDMIDDMDEGRIAQCPAVVCGDESNAFERVSLIWLRQGHDKVGIPRVGKGNLHGIGHTAGG